MTPHTHMHTPRPFTPLKSPGPATTAQTPNNKDEKERERENTQDIINLLIINVILVVIILWRLYTVGHTWTLLTVELWVYVAMVLIFFVAMIGLGVAAREDFKERTLADHEEVEP